MDIKEIQTISLLSNMLWIVILLNKDAYRIIRVEKIESILFRMIKQLLIHSALIGIFVTALNYLEVSMSRLFYFYCLFFMLLFLSRVVFMKILKYLRFRGYNHKNVIIVGANEIGERMRRILAKDLTFGYRVLGFFDDKNDVSAFTTAPFLGSFTAIQDFIIREKVDEMYIALQIDNLKWIKELTALCERNLIRIKFIPDFQQYTLARKVEITFYDTMPVLILRKEPLEITINILLKRAFDLVFSSLVILLLFPLLFPIFFILIKIDSAGPIFFLQQRSGRENISFTCLKFRTMKVNDSSNSVQATKGDPRITKMGAFMRRNNIDELPQFFNVWWGSMTVVGPRPHMVSQTDLYSELISNYLVRHYAKPGITGWAQVNGFRGETKELVEMKNRVDHDIWYIENWGLLLDLKIIYRTVFNMAIGEEKAC
jgi:undecaprenyl-phosphate galactose phosphotransferase/putative colanic acid biosynthesis UDP-glucose lipid carrier transferase